MCVAGGGGGGQVPMNSSSHALRSANTEKTPAAWQQQYYNFQDGVTTKQTVYSATCSFDSCAEQSHKDRVRTTSC